MATELRLVIGKDKAGSYVKEGYFTTPLKLGTPNSSEYDLNVVLMMASAGILKGDEFNYHVECENDTELLLTEQSYSKLFDMTDGYAKKKMKIKVGHNASLFYCPQTVIPFEGSNYESKLEVELEKDSTFSMWDILAVGRVGMGEVFKMRHFQNITRVKVDGKLAWIDGCLLEPDNMKLDNLFYFDKYTHQGVFYFYGAKALQTKLLELEENNKFDVTWAASEATEGVVVRALGKSAQNIEHFFAFLIESVKD